MTMRKLRFPGPAALLGVLALSLAGCVWLIVVAQRYADPPVPTGDAVFRVPLTPTASEDDPQ